MSGVHEAEGRHFQPVKMKTSPRIYIYVWTGTLERARATVGQHFPGRETAFISHEDIRQGGWRRQVKALRELRGEALVSFFDSIEDARQLELIRWTGLIHRCRLTAVADGHGYFRAIRRRDWLWMWPRTAAGLIADAVVFALAWLLLPLLRRTARPIAWRGWDSKHSPEARIAYLYCSPIYRVSAGGAMSHVRGVLSGLAANGIACDIYSGCRLPVEGFPQHVIGLRRQLGIFWESLLLSYNVHFARSVRAQLNASPLAFYQRHGRFIFAGALLARWTGAPLVLEYNGSEVWLDRYWDPGRFSRLLALCEDAALAHASLVVVVSEPLKQELLRRGIPEERILVNPNAVDSDYFYPGGGDPGLRRRLGVAPDEILVTFVGTFGPWHGVEVLGQAIRQLLAQSPLRVGDPQFRFLLVGEGSLSTKLRALLERAVSAGHVIFAGMVPHEYIRDYLDASDILVSPHVPMPDGSDFFGSPTKLFEYMAMGKGIVASRLNQIGEVLRDRETALLVEPGNADELAETILALARNPELRRRLGQGARQAAVTRHSWKQNAARVLQQRPIAGAVTPEENYIAAEHYIPDWKQKV